MMTHSAPLLAPFITNTTLSDIAKIFDQEPFLFPKIVFGRENEEYVNSTNNH